MIDVQAEPLGPDAFAPFGTVVRAPLEPSRLMLPEALGNLRAEAKASLSVSRSSPGKLPLTTQVMERHRYSTQTFLPLEVGRYLVMVAPNAADGGPDMRRAHAFIVPAGTGISYAADTWHHPQFVLDRPASFAVVMWRDGTAKDIETVTLAEPVTVREG